MAPVLAAAEAADDVAACERDDRYDEVWEGVLVMSPAPNMDHQDIQAILVGALVALIRLPGLGRVYGGLNVSDRAKDWRGNYRVPDVGVYLAGNPAVRHKSHMQGGPDFAVEVVSDDEDAHAKLGFYAAVGTRELLVVHRSVAALELFRLDAGTLALAGSAAPGVGVAEAQTVGLNFALEAGDERPAVVVTHPATGQVWRA